MFELSVAKKYLVPRKKQLSSTLIAVMSITVISLVVWLVLLFLSVTDGMERSWLQKLTMLNAPLRITPTEAYYSSYYYRIDAFSQNAQFMHKTIGEKAVSVSSDPFSPEEDGELPSSLPPPDRRADGQIKDPVKQAFQVLRTLKEEQSDIAFQDFELSGALLKLHLHRKAGTPPSFLTQVSYLSTFSGNSPYLKPLILPPTQQDIAHLAHLSTPPSWVYSVGDQLFLPEDRDQKKAVLLAKNFQESGVLLGDSGHLSYQAASMASVQEQRIPIYVAGFYDPGVIPVGNKCVLVSPEITRTINASSPSFAFEKTEENGILVWFNHLKDAEKIKSAIEKQFAAEGIAPYWKVTTFREYSFAKNLLEQFQSDKYLFSLLAAIILLVACSNIISLLILLVNDKKREIGILQSMGASSKSIMLIFASCGVFMGALSSCIGTGAALFTLKKIDTIVRFLSFLQGHEAFNAAFYGSSLPKELSSDALLFVLIATPLLSLVAGLVPAILACRLKPSAILRSE